MQLQLSLVGHFALGVCGDGETSIFGTNGLIFHVAAWFMH